MHHHLFFCVFITKNLPDHRGPKKRKKTQLKMESEEEKEETEVPPAAAERGHSKQHL